MEDQVKRLANLNCITTAYAGSDHCTDSHIKDGKIDIIFASPETAVGDKAWREAIQQLQISLIVVDEFHTIATWGGLEKDEERNTFRKWFRHVGELRSLFPEAAMLALSATCTKQILTRVVSVLGMDDCETFITVSPNRENIKYVVHQVDPSIECAMLWLLEGLGNLMETFPRTLIYRNSIKDVGHLYHFLVTELPDLVKYVEMFHSETMEDKKKEIVSKLSVDSELRVVISTSALGMGVDVSACQNIILYGPPYSIVDLLQETGRAGRDGTDSVALIMYNRYQTRNIDDDVKQVIRSNSCRRLSIMDKFASAKHMQKIEKQTNLHTCCDICANFCKCNSCCVSPLEKLLHFSPLDDHDQQEESDSDTISYEYESDHADLENLDFDEELIEL
ncbi:ATP-dependent DNA helicase Q1-like [Pecten maximus]|uniref:ATP-dependent DNA helicase Q1-like n=1 Tax=Pecten maximus TaxID=6579 RepID=UPI001458EE4C|nr:ATP-dependent DNA helicase Q1-like [Pecten maximus]